MDKATIDNLIFGQINEMTADPLTITSLAIHSCFSYFVLN